MSTTLGVSPFYDVSDVLYQSRKASYGLAQLPGGCMPVTTESRRILGAGAPRSAPVPTSPERYSPLCGSLSGYSDTSSGGSGGSSPVLGNSIRKLDRSVSEPLDKKLAQVNSSRYKTELCRPFEENGHCKYGDKCQFAHGFPELRSLSRHPKYKTELCRTFHTIGFCPYGPRCHFIHNEDLRRLHQISQNKQPLSPPISDMIDMPAGVRRPRVLSFSMSMIAANERDSLGSIADDSPASSITDSPTMSPTFLDELAQLPYSPLQQHQLQQQHLQQQQQQQQSAFTFPGEDVLLTQALVNSQAMLSPQTEQLAAQLAAQLQQLSLARAERALSERVSESRAARRDLTELLMAPPPAPSSPPHTEGSVELLLSSCGPRAPRPARQVSAPTAVQCPLEVSRNLRLPIFNQLAGANEN